VCDYTPEQLEKIGPCLDPRNYCENEACSETCGRESNFCPGCGKKNPHFEEAVFKKEFELSLADALQICREGHAQEAFKLAALFPHQPHCAICGLNLFSQKIKAKDLGP